MYLASNLETKFWWLTADIEGRQWLGRKTAVYPVRTVPLLLVGEGKGGMRYPKC